jgi:acyl-CoA synthetase (AMP-forming)/AMP-acid ligase II
LALKENVEFLARALARELDWSVNKGSEFSKVALNTIDVPTVNWAILRLNGVSTPANAAYNATELGHQLKSCKAQALFTVSPLLDVALAAARDTGV